MTQSSDPMWATDWEYRSEPYSVVRHLLLLLLGHQVYDLWPRRRRNGKQRLPLTGKAEAGLTGERSDSPTAEPAGETFLRLRIEIEPEESLVSLVRGAVIALEVIRQHSASFVAVEPGLDDVVRRWREVETLVSEGGVRRETGGLLNIVTYKVEDQPLLTFTQPSSNVAPDVKFPPTPP